MIDNLDIIKTLLNFEEGGEDFYMLYIFKRKKDQPEGERDNHQSVRTIRSYCINSVEQLERKYDEIKLMCETFKARAYIHIQKQNHKDVSLELMIALAQRLKQGLIQQQGLFDSVVGQLKTYESRWIVDVDTKDENELLRIMNYINSVKPHSENPKCIKIIPTKNGFHIITERFDVIEFQKQYPDISIQKKNPTLLYLPNSLE